MLSSFIRIGPRRQPEISCQLHLEIVSRYPRIEMCGKSLKMKQPWDVHVVIANFRESTSWHLFDISGSLHHVICFLYCVIVVWSFVIFVNCMYCDWRKGTPFGVRYVAWCTSFPPVFIVFWESQELVKGFYWVHLYKRKRVRSSMWFFKTLFYFYTPSATHWAWFKLLCISISTEACHEGISRTHTLKILGSSFMPIK